MEFEYNGKTITLVEEAYASNYGTNGSVRYEAHAEDEEGEEYKVVWQTTKEFDLSQELCLLEGKEHDELTDEEKERMAEILGMDITSAYAEDESNACDWYSPIEIYKI